MTTGIIIVFRNNEKELKAGNLLRTCLKFQSIDLCLVNNASSDKTLELLIDVKEEFQSHVEVIDIKKQTTVTNAIKAGERYLANSQNLKLIGYINIEDITSADALGHMLTTFNGSTTLKSNINSLLKKPLKGQFMKNIFSVIEYMSYSNFVYPNSIK